MAGKNKPPASHATVLPFDDGLASASTSLLGIRRVDDQIICAALLSGPDDRRSYGVLGISLSGGRQPQDGDLVNSLFQRGNGNDAWLAPGKRAGFVEGKRAEVTQRLKVGAPLGEYAVSSSCRDTRDNGDRGGNHERARACYDE